MILIWSDTGKWGGVDVLIGRYAEHLRRRQHPFLIAEPEGSRLRDDIPWAEFIDPLKTDAIIGDVRRVFMPSVAKLRNQRFPWEKLAAVPLFTWLVEPNEPFTQFVPFGGAILKFFGYSGVRPLLKTLPAHARHVGELFRLLTKGGSLAIMDAACCRALRFFFPTVNLEHALLVPVPAPIGEPIGVPSLPSEPLVVGYLGRMDAIKWSALQPVVDIELRAIARTRRVRLVGVCEGNEIGLVEDACRRSGVEFDYRGYMPNNAARVFLRRQTHFAVAMGTSALDLAAVGHPCIVIDPAMRTTTPAQRLFRFIHEAEGFALGEFRDFPHYQQGLRSFADSVQLALSENLSEQGRCYVREAHSPERCFASIDLAIEACTTTVGEVASVRASIARSYDAKYRLYSDLRGRDWSPMFGAYR